MRLGDDLVTVSPPNPGNNEYRGNRLVRQAPDNNDTPCWRSPPPPSMRLPDGSLLVAGAEQRTDYGALDWGYYRFTAAADGTVTRKRLADIEDMEARPAGISLGSGILTTADDSKLYQPGGILGGYRSTWLKTSGRPEELRTTTDGFVAGRDDDCSTTWRVYCVSMFASGDGHHGRKAGTEQDLTMLYRNGSSSWGPRLTTGLSSPRLIDLSGRYGVANQASGGSQAVIEFRGTDSGAVLQKREPVASALWGNTLWSATDNANTVTSKTLPAGTAGESFTTVNRCEPTELQAVGRWVYWKCRDDSWDVRGGGLYDRSTKRFLSLGSDETLLGDDYLVSRSDSTGLTLVDLHNGIPASGKVADLPQRVVATPAQLGANTTRRAGWTVDRFGGHVAYTGDDRRVRIVPSGVPAPRIAVIDRDTAASADVKSMRLAAPLVAVQARRLLVAGAQGQGDRHGRPYPDGRRGPRCGRSRVGRKEHGGPDRRERVVHLDPDGQGRRRPGRRPVGLRGAVGDRRCRGVAGHGRRRRRRPAGDGRGRCDVDVPGHGHGRALGADRRHGHEVRRVVGVRALRRRERRRLRGRPRPGGRRAARLPPRVRDGRLRLVAVHLDRLGLGPVRRADVPRRRERRRLQRPGGAPGVHR